MTSKKQFDSASHIAAMQTAISAETATHADMLDRMGETRATVRALLTDDAGTYQSKAGCIIDLIRSWNSETGQPLAKTFYQILKNAVSDETAAMRNNGTDIWVSLDRRNNGEKVACSIGAEPQSKAQETAHEKRQAKQAEKDAAEAAAAAAITGDGMRASLRAFVPAVVGIPDSAVTLEQFEAAVLQQMPAAATVPGLILRLLEHCSADDKARIVAACAKPQPQPVEKPIAASRERTQPQPKSNSRAKRNNGTAA